MKRRAPATALLALVLVALVAATIGAQQVYPAAEWERADIARGGWSATKLADARRWFDSLRAGSAVIVEHGRVVAEWGDPAKRVKLSSVRKSFLSALYGIHVRTGDIDISKTLAELGIDDNPPLTDGEKTATIRTLLQARSGVYHPFVGGSGREAMPARGSHPPGTFWYYNNWDFNALGTIFEQLTRKRIGADFEARIAAPIGMQDFRAQDVYYYAGTAQTAAVEASIHPAYHFRMSARDMARFGYLFLRGGAWNGTQIIPADWVTESTTPYSNISATWGYGYLWWINGFPGVSPRVFGAWGALGKYIIVIPERDLVVVYVNHFEYPDDAAALTMAQILALPNASQAQIGTLLARILDAQAASVRQ